jgi:hypothetical protein
MYFIAVCSFRFSHWCALSWVSRSTRRVLDIPDNNIEGFPLVRPFFDPVTLNNE